MAPQGSMATPTIVEPASPLGTHSPAHSLTTPSLDPNSSSNSTNSSRPHSQNSSNTSHTRSPSPPEDQSWMPEDFGSQNAFELSPSWRPTRDQPPSTDAPSNPFLSEGDASQSILPSSHTNTTISSQSTYIQRQKTWLSEILAKIHEKRWLEITIAALSVATAIWLGVRGYKLAVWESWNSLRQTCASYIQSNVTLGSRCKKLLEGDPPAPPYWLKKWAAPTLKDEGANVVKRNIFHLCGNSSGQECDNFRSSYLNIPSSITIVIASLAIGLLYLFYLRCNPKNEEVYTSAAREEPPDSHLALHYDDGRKLVLERGVITKEKVEDEEYPGDLWQGLLQSQETSNSSIKRRQWSSGSSAAETLVEPSAKAQTPSNVSLHDKSKGEKHEGLVELNLNGKRMAFFKPSTSELFFISRWKSAHSEDEEPDDKDHVKDECNEKINTHHGLGHAIAEGISSAVQERVDQKIAQRMEKMDRKKHR